METNDTKPMVCDTCGKETDRVSRVVVDSGYNRVSARPVYNCPDCYQAKLRSREEPNSVKGAD